MQRVCKKLDVNRKDYLHVVVRGRWPFVVSSVNSEHLACFTRLPRFYCCDYTFLSRDFSIGIAEAYFYSKSGSKSGR
jgi:hypothetical protein